METFARFKTVAGVVFPANFVYLMSVYSKESFKAFTYNMRRHNNAPL